jgi:membrane protein DedA with SNARE-associated domain/rhodanese-related sulfurtransferase
MGELINFLLRHGYSVVFFSVLAEQAGLPLPAVPVLVSTGALARSGTLSFSAVILTAVTASLIADVIWYSLGRRHGRAVLTVICRISLEPDYCVRRTQDAFARRGLWTVMFAKFVPGLNAAAVPLAGMIRISPARFLAVDIAGLLLWSGTYTLLGYIFSEQVELLINYLRRLGISFVVFVLACLAAYIAFKYRQRKKFLSTLVATRITPEELRSQMDARRGVTVLDLRNQLDVTTDRVRIPGAFHVIPEHLDMDYRDIPADQDLVLYCTCPNEATSARVARRLLQMGFSRVRPLAGGLDAWRSRGFPVESIDG